MLFLDKTHLGYISTKCVIYTVQFASYVKRALVFPRIKGTATLDIMLPGCYSHTTSTGANKLHSVLYTEIGTCSGYYF